MLRYVRFTEMSYPSILNFQLIYSDEESDGELVEMRNHGTLPMTPRKETRSHGTEPMTAAHVPRKSKWYPEVGNAIIIIALRELHSYTL